MPDEKENKLDWGSFIGALEAKRDLLDQAIASLKAAMAAGGLGGAEGMSFVNLAGTVVNPSIHNGEVPAGAFLRKSIPEAAKLYLSIVKKKQTTKQIADALLDGGIETSSKSFEVTVGTGLYRASRTAGEIVKLKSGAWGLAEWYPAGMRTSHEARGKRKPRNARRAKQKEPEAPALPAASPVTKKLSDRIIEMLAGDTNLEFTKKEISEALGVKSQIAAPVLARLQKKKLIRMSAPDTYSALQNAG